MEMMRAAVLERAPGGLRIEEIPIPEPLAGEVLVKVAACGVCHTDLHVMKAEVAFPTPAVMGHEISGTVAALGPGVAGPAVGTPVASAFIMPCGFCAACGAGRDDLCDNFFAMNRLKGTLYDGTTRLRREGRHAAGDVLDGRTGGILRSCRPPTSSRCPPACRWRNRRCSAARSSPPTAPFGMRADLRGGERIAVVAAGGVGINIIQIARAFGASQIIAVDVRDDKLEAARRLGATDVVNATRDGCRGARARADRRPRRRRRVRGARACPQTFMQAFEMIRDGGRMVGVGIAPGKPTAAGRDHPPGPPRAAHHRLLRRADAHATCRRSSASRRRASSGRRRW